MKNLLLTGFTPFLNHSTNPTEELIRNFEIDSNTLNITKWIFPVEYEEVKRQVPVLLEEISPDYIINLGYASDRFAITPEIAALNYIDSESPDNKGIIIRNSKIVDSAPNAYFTHFNWSRFINLLKDNNIPSKTSSDAGTYLCNYTSFLFQDCIHQMQLDTKQGFVHIPKMDIKVLNKALHLLIQSLEA
tara:strand:- start:98222 stop:98788 length:567 start_codon:yes stop_codon:yes gene_type:complete